MRTSKGFSYFEVITVLVILGIIASVGSLGLTQIVRGYNTTVQGAEVLQKAQLALERISMEIALFDSKSIQEDFSASQLHYELSERVSQNETYTSDEFTIAYDANQQVINLIDNDTNTTYLLVNGVNNFNITYYRSDGTTPVSAGELANTIAVILMDITMSNGTTFSLRVAPNY